ncbi:MAG: methyltransferase domain-containing protein [Bradymonadales bacterium]|nr:methyltransferase domain-containing protein [Bradymonadales bacterium]
MSTSHKHEPGTPMPHAHAAHLLNPLRALVLSPRALVRRLELEPDFAVLELGPGPGYFSPAVARALPQGKLVLVDIQQEMLEMAKKRLDDQGVVNVEYCQGDALALPAEDGSFDVAFLVSVLGEVPDRARSVKELHRVLRPGGLLSVTEMGLFDPDAVPLAELQALVEAEGFHRYSCHRRLGHFTLGFRRSD